MMNTAHRRSGLARIAEAMAFLAVSRTTVYQLMHSGELPFVKLGRARRVPWDQLSRLVERQTRNERPGESGPIPLGTT